MTGPCIASRLHDFLYRRTAGEDYDRIRREVANQISPRDYPRLRAADLLLQGELPRIFSGMQHQVEDWIQGSYRLLEPADAQEDRNVAEDMSLSKEELQDDHLR